MNMLRRKEIDSYFQEESFMYFKENRSSKLIGQISERSSSFTDSVKWIQTMNLLVKSESLQWAGDDYRKDSKARGSGKLYISL